MIPLDWLTMIGLLSAALSVLAFIPYVRDMMKGKTLPLRSTWLIWTVLSTTSLLSNITEGATHSLFFVGMQAALTAMICLMSVWYGTGSFFRAGDRHVLALAGAGTLLWWATDTALWSLTITITVSALGGIVTVVKSYRAPGTETEACWCILTVAAAGGALSVGAWDPLLLAYPLYLFALYGSILTALWLGRRHQRGISQLGPQPQP